MISDGYSIISFYLGIGGIAVGMGNGKWLGVAGFDCGALHADILCNMGYAFYQVSNLEDIASMWIPKYM